MSIKMPVTSSDKPRTAQEVLARVNVLVPVLHSRDENTVAEIFAQIARGYPSTSWICTIMVAASVLPALLVDEAADEIYAAPDLRDDRGLRANRRGASGQGRLPDGLESAVTCNRRPCRSHYRRCSPWPLTRLPAEAGGNHKRALSRRIR
jgi:hypothetical protein